MDQQMERAGNFLPRVDEGSGSTNAVDKRVVTLTAPASLAAEQYRSLYYRLERMRELRPLKVVGVTSSLPGEGKTVTTPETLISAEQEGGHMAIVGGTNLQSLVNGLNKIGLKPAGIIAILQAIKTAGALQAELVVQ